MQRNALILGVILLLMGSIVSPLSIGVSLQEQTMVPLTQSSGPMDSSWPMYGHDARNTGKSTISTINNPYDLKWSYETEFGGIDSAPAIAPDGTIYVGCNNYYLHAFHPNGTLKWQHDCNEFISSSPAIAPDGTIHVGSWDHYLYAINPDGTRKWRFLTGDVIKSSPVIDPNGIIYFGILGPGSGKGRLFALYQNGSEKWHYDTNGFIFSSPAYKNDTIYVTSNDRCLHAINETGSSRWKYQFNDLLGSPSVAADGTIYVACWDGNLYAINSNGTYRWSSSIGWGSGKTPSIGSDGTIYIGGDELYAINPDGSRKWSFDPGMGYDITASANAICGDGIIYIGTSKESGGGYIIAINPDGTERWREWIHNEWVWSAPAIDSEGSVYIGVTSDDSGWPYGVLYAFGELDQMAPGTPDIDGRINGKKGESYEYTFTSIDPNNDDVYYYIQWGDGQVEEWIGPYASGESVEVSHSWSDRGQYTIRARAKDTDNNWGSWGELEVSMPKTFNYPGWQWLCERFPLLSRLLNLLGGLE